MTEKLRLNKFCCCCTLKTGCIINAILELIISICEVSVSLTQTIESLSDPNNPDEGSPEEQAFSYVYIALSILLSILIIVSVLRESRKLILIWLIILFFLLIIIYIGTFWLFIEIFVSSQAAGFIILFVEGLIPSIHYTYFYLCVWSYYQELGETDTKSQPMTTDNDNMDLDKRNQNIV